MWNICPFFKLIAHPSSLTLIFLPSSGHLPPLQGNSPSSSLNLGGKIENTSGDEIFRINSQFIIISREMPPRFWTISSRIWLWGAGGVSHIWRKVFVEICVLVALRMDGDSLKQSNKYSLPEHPNEQEQNIWSIEIILLFTVLAVSAAVA